MKNIKFIWSYMEGKRLLYTGAIICVALGTVISIINPLILQVTIDSIIGDLPLDLPAWLQARLGWITNNEQLLKNLMLAGLSLVLLTILNGVFLYFRGKWSAAASEGIAKNLRDELYNHLQHLSYDYHVKAKTGDLIQRCTSDVDQIRLFLGVQLVEVSRAIFIITVSFTIMFRIYRKLTLVAVASVPFIIAYSYYFYLLVKKTFKDADEAEAGMTTVLQENLTGVRVVRAFARENYEIDKFEEKNKDYRDKVHRVIRYLAWYWSVSDFICLTQIAAVLITGVYWVVQGEISLGNLVVFVSYESMLIWPVRQLGRILTDLGKMQVAIDRIQEILEEETEFPAKEGLKPEIEGEISFNNVSFAYKEGQPILRNVSFQVKKGQTVAILGPTGSGKSTLVHLLTRLYDCQGGSILIDGYDIKEIDKKWLRKHVGLILQEPFLFACSIKENIAFADPSITEEEIYEAARIASIHEAILEFEQGYDTPVGERGVSLSGGQKQRIAIARALIRKGPILIFDDSLSAVDTETDLQIRRALQEMSKDTTTFIISHRINTLSRADLILVLEDGEIVQRGSHEELVRQEGMYRRIWEIQNSLEEVN
ncbi:MAG TPA: ABC transporter ATP-binding protein [Halanaerobiales bacterium]|jgi:ATP-binding cassette subfamily B protein|nr:ABC transporter ATP-binding protein [Halanaerobiales bacterium]HPZ62895.1 ABC transporter ATP-binding protein [Halanaerobiales bacterium]HQD04106.1 ABC transporter ATP-binding protein [Halanaerobiales bacterium]